VVTRRPSVDDAGGDQKVDDAAYPPDPKEHATAAGWNQQSMQIAAMAKVVGACKLEVRFNAGVPFLQRVSAPGNNVLLETFTVTDNGTGDTTITWPAYTFPEHICSPTGLTLFSNSTSVVAGHVEEVTDGIRVRTFVAGVASNVPFTITIN
jgi:hypothetical protein